MVSTHPINTRNGFGGGFIGDYTDIAVGSDNTFHAFWTDTNNKQTVVWFYGLEFVPTPINQEDVVTASGQLLATDSPPPGEGPGVGNPRENARLFSMTSYNKRGFVVWDQLLYGRTGPRHDLAKDRWVGVQAGYAATHCAIRCKA